MSLAADLRVLRRLVFRPRGGATHAERLDAFYRGQAGDYDAFRERLLRGRAELYAAVPVPDGGTWVEMGGGTARNLEFLGDAALARLRRVVVVDLAPSLLRVAAARVAARGWRHVELVEADATKWLPAEGPGTADVVTFSYALTMIPDWFRAIDHAHALLRPGGRIAVVDFHVSRRRPDPGRARHAALTRLFWPAWFAWDDVMLSPDHLPYLERRFEAEQVVEARAPVPYVPIGRVPIYRFVGRKAGAAS